MTTTKQYDWQLVCRNKGGHSFWRDNNTGRISICDLSGDRPDLTDDGVLWIEGLWTLSDGTKEPVLDIPVICARDGSRSWCSTPALDGLAIAETLGFQVVVNDRSRIAKLIPHLKKLT